MVRTITKILAIAIISMLCSSVVFAQRTRPAKQNLKKQRSLVSSKATGKHVVNKKLSATRSIIYSEDFEGSDVLGTLPDGWVRFTDWDPQVTPEIAEEYQIWVVVNDNVDYDGSGSNIAGVEGGFAFSHSGEQQLVMSWVGTGGNSWAITPGFNMVAEVEYTVSFWLEMEGYPPFDEVMGLMVTIGQEQTAEGMDNGEVIFLDFDDYYDYSNYPAVLSGHVEMIYSFTPETSGTYYLGFKDITGEEEGLYTLIDDIEISADVEIPEQCDAVTNLAVNFDDDCIATLTWTAPAGVSSFDIYRDNVKIETVTGTTYTESAATEDNHKWKVTYTCENGEESLPATVTGTCTLVGISQLSSKVSVYPNPAKNVVYIDGKNFVKVEIYNMFGQLVDTQKGNIKSIDVSKYNTGVYMLKAYDVNNNMVITNITVTR